MKETIISILVVVVAISGAVYLTQDREVVPVDNEEVVEEVPVIEEVPVVEDEEMANLVNCLKEKGVAVYGSRTCPYCSQMVEQYGGIGIIGPIYYDCSGLGTAEETEICRNNMKADYVPEVQINGETYEGARDPQSLAREVGCEL